MKTLQFFLFISIMFAFLSCKKTTSEPNLSVNNSIIGSWKNVMITDSIYIYTRTAQLTENEYSFSIKTNSQFIERKNSSWCGTPPVSFYDYQGIWYATDSIINISVGFWGGIADYQWKLISVDNQYLKIYKIKESYRTN